MDRRFTFISVVVMFAAGCQQNPYVSSHLEILGAERRALEDRVLDLEFELERAEKKLKARNGGESSDASPRRSRPSPRDAEMEDEGDLTSPLIITPGFDDDLPPTLEPPRVNEGRPTDGVLPIPSGDSASQSPRYQKPTRPIAVRSRGPGDPRITHIELNPTLTGGADFDRKSGDDGLVVVLEPRNADNEFVPLAGPVSVVVLDYAKRNEGTAAMVARWDVDAKNVHKAIVNDENGQGIQLRLPWPNAMPEHNKLRLDVRYTTADGRHLDSRADVYVTLPGQFSARWTPRAPRTSDGQEPAPNGNQSPVNIARQPESNESAANTHASDVVQSAFTTVARAAEIVSDEPADIKAKAADVSTAKSRPTWTPNR